ncbi:MAG: endonuclease domain-containing protein [Ignavibacteriae bacterium]|nr:endonuclease domain-containing protein [Ignavibacteriota bacterium]
MVGCPQDGVVEVQTYINGIPIYRNFVAGLPYNSSLKKRAIEFRKRGILSEVLFWQQVHNYKFHNIDFDRQRIIGNYIVDFYIKTLGVVVEIDGSSHDEKVEYDTERLRFLEGCGLKIYRVTDSDIKNNINGVMRGLEEFIIENCG